MAFAVRKNRDTAYMMAGSIFSSTEENNTKQPIRAHVENLVQVRHHELEVRLATTPEEIVATQELRYRVFYEEMKAIPSAEVAAVKRDFDRMDEICDHLLVLDHAKGSGLQSVVGTYRLATRQRAMAKGGFYSASEFDIAPLENFDGNILELGRSCVDAAYRTGATMQLLWRGIAGYVFAHDIKLMFGCASIPGIDVPKIELQLAYLYHHHLAEKSIRPKALESLYVDMNLLPKENIDIKKALMMLPPLIKGYLRLGGMVGDGAVVDRDFNTTDVCVVLRTELVTEKYYKHYRRAVPEAASEAVSENNTALPLHDKI